MHNTMPKLEMPSTATQTRWWERKHITRQPPSTEQTGIPEQKHYMIMGRAMAPPPTQLCAKTAAMSKAQKVASLTRIILSAEERNTDRDTDRHEESPVHSTALVNADPM